MRVPDSLSDASRKEWRHFARLFTITETTGRVLLEYLQAGERMRAAQKLIDAEGLCVQDRFRQTRAHPACNIIRDAQSIRLRCLKDLPLDGDKADRKPWSGGRKRRGTDESPQAMLERHERAKAALAQPK